MQAPFRSLAVLPLLLASMELMADQRLLGTWNCAYAVQEQDVSVTSETREIYASDGRIDSSGTMRVRMSPEMPEISYSLAATGHWEMADDALVVTASEVRIVNLSHPEFDRLLDLQEMMPEGISESMAIVELSAADLILRSETDGRLYNCRKARASI